MLIIGRSSTVAPRNERARDQDVTQAKTRGKSDRWTSHQVGANTGIIVR